MQFVGQTHLLRVPLPDGRPDPRRPAGPLRARLPRPLPRRAPRDPRQPRQPQLLGHRHPPRDRPRAPHRRPPAAAPRLADAQTGTRPVRFAGGWHDTPVYRRDHLPADAALDRPRDRRADGHHHRPRARRPATQDADGNLLIQIGAQLAADRYPSRSASSTLLRRIEAGSSDDTPMASSQICPTRDPSLQGLWT